MSATIANTLSIKKLFNNLRILAVSHLIWMEDNPNAVAKPLSMHTAHEKNPPWRTRAGFKKYRAKRRLTLFFAGLATTYSPVP